MEIYSKEGTLFAVQIDHLPGECIGQVVDVFYQAGASNVQVISTVTKKNRPAYIIWIDCREERAEQVERTIVKELHTGGWHKIRTEHRYLHNEIHTKEITLCHGKKTCRTAVLAKHFLGGGIRPEHDSVAALKRLIAEEFSLDTDYYTLYAFVMAAILNPDSGELNLEILGETSAGG